MAAAIQLPSVFDPTNPQALKRDLERTTSALDQFARELASKYRPRWVPSKDVFLSDCAAAFDIVTRVSPRASQTIVVSLPRVNTVHGGRECRVQRMTTTGALMIVSHDSTINGYAGRYIMHAAPGFVTLQFDGAAWFTDNPGCADSGEGL